MFQTANPADATTQAALNLVNFVYGNWQKILLSLALLAIALLVIRFLQIAIKQIGKDYNLSSKTIRAINTVLTYGVVILAFVNVLAVFQIDLYPLIVSLGFISAVVVLGSQMIISNLLGGAVVYIEKPFMVEDVIKVGENVGVVENISIRSTTMRALNGLIITIPNSTYLTTPITNFTRTHLYLVKLPFTAPRDIDMSSLVDVIRSRATSIPDFVSDKGETLYKMGISKDNVDYELQFWVADPRSADNVRSHIVDIVAQFLPSKSQS